MTEVTYMRPPMHNTLVLRNLREYRNKYSATESVGISVTMHFYIMRRQRYGIRWNDAWNRHYAVQGNLRSPILVPIESSYTTSY